MNSKIFYSSAYQSIQNRVKDFLNARENFLSPETAESTRATGDAIEKILSNGFKDILGDLCSDYQKDFARRAMADLYFRDHDNFHYIVDVKTHRQETNYTDRIFELAVFDNRGFGMGASANKGFEQNYYLPWTFKKRVDAGFMSCDGDILSKRNGKNR